MVENSDPDQGDKLNPDLHQGDADPQHCRLSETLKKIVVCNLSGICSLFSTFA
jgi:hypothetical protein